MSGRSGWLALALLGLGGCAPDAGKPARLWTIEDFVVARADAGAKFAGLEVTRLFAREMDTLPWRGATAAKPGLVVWPGFARGAPQAFVISDVWDEHPRPWVQPTYLLATAYDPKDPLAALLKRGDGTQHPSIFPVGTTTRFYTPFWRATLVVVPANSQGFTDATAVVASNAPQHQGPLVLCPISAMDGGAGVAVAESPTGLEHPLTRAPLKALGVGRAFVDGQEIRYLASGLNRAVADDHDAVTEFPAYFFVVAEGDDVTPLPLPPVLPDEPLTQSLWRRVDVVVQPPMGVYFATDLPAVRGALDSAGVALKVQDADGGVPRDFSLRVAKDRACFDDPNFPTACAWLDGRAAVEALPDSQRKATGTLITGVILERAAP